MKERGICGIWFPGRLAEWGGGRYLDKCCWQPFCETICLFGTILSTQDKVTFSGGKRNTRKSKYLSKTPKFRFFKKFPFPFFRAEIPRFYSEKKRTFDIKFNKFSRELFFIGSVNSTCTHHVWWPCDSPAANQRYSTFSLWNTTVNRDWCLVELWYPLVRRKKRVYWMRFLLLKIPRLREGKFFHVADKRFYTWRQRVFPPVRRETRPNLYLPLKNLSLKRSSLEK